MIYFTTSPDWGAIADWFRDHSGSLALALALLILVDQFLRRVVPPALRMAMAHRMVGQPEEEVRKRADTLIHVAQRSGWTAALILALLVILPELGVNITALVTGLGIAGIALGFGTQSLVRDILNGIFILAENQYSKGDVVRVAGLMGVVEEVGLRRTVLRDLDGTVHSVPNGEIRISSNFTREWSRVQVDITVAHGEDLDKVFAVISRVGEELARDPQLGPLILTPPQPLRVEAFQDTGIAIRVVGDTQPMQQWPVKGELLRRLKAAFDREGIRLAGAPPVEIG